MKILTLHVNTNSEMLLKKENCWFLIIVIVEGQTLVLFIISETSKSCNFYNRRNACRGKFIYFL
jgi:hypothetical protein